jgi:hypothetical protein
VLPADCDSRYDLLAYIYYLVYTELAPEILWVGDHIEHLNAKLIVLNYNTLSLHYVGVLPEVIAHEVNCKRSQNTVR